MLEFVGERPFADFNGHPTFGFQTYQSLFGIFRFSLNGLKRWPKLWTPSEATPTGRVSSEAAKVFGSFANFKLQASLAN